MVKKLNSDWWSETGGLGGEHRPSLLKSCILVTHPSARPPSLLLYNFLLPLVINYYHLRALTLRCKLSFWGTEMIDAAELNRYYLLLSHSFFFLVKNWRKNYITLNATQQLIVLLEIWVLYAHVPRSLQHRWGGGSGLYSFVKLLQTSVPTSGATEASLHLQ